MNKTEFFTLSLWLVMEANSKLGDWVPYDEGGDRMFLDAWPSSFFYLLFPLLPSGGFLTLMCIMRNLGVPRPQVRHQGQVRHRRVQRGRRGRLRAQH